MSIIIQFHVLTVLRNKATLLWISWALMHVCQNQLHLQPWLDVFRSGVYCMCSYMYIYYTRTYTHCHIHNVNAYIMCMHAYNRVAQSEFRKISGSSRKSSLGAAEEVHSARAKSRESKVKGGGSSWTQYEEIRRFVQKSFFSVELRGHEKIRRFGHK